MFFEFNIFSRALHGKELNASVNLIILKYMLQNYMVIIC